MAAPLDRAPQSPAPETPFRAAPVPVPPRQSGPQVSLARWPARLLRRALWRWVYPWLVRRHPGVQARGRLVLRGMPYLEVVRGARVELGDGVTLNSSNEGYHLNMFAPVKLLADVPGAEIVIGDNTRIHGTCVHAYVRVEIGRNCLIAANTQIMDGGGHDLVFDDPGRRGQTRGTARPVVIGDNVWIGTGVIILPGTTIGEGTVVGAGSVVSGTLPPRVLAGGNPARVVRDYSQAAREGAGS